MSEFQSSPEMIYAVWQKLDSESSATKKDIKEAIAGLIVWLADPQNAEDAQAWAKATMNVAAFSYGEGGDEVLLHTVNEDYVDVDKMTPLYRVREQR